MEDIGQRLRARYLLAAPEMITQNVRPSFGQYLSDYPGRFGADPTFASYGAAAPMYQDEVARTPAEELAELRSRAREAAQAATTAPGIYAAGAVIAARAASPALALNSAISAPTFRSIAAP